MSGTPIPQPVTVQISILQKINFRFIDRSKPIVLQAHIQPGEPGTPATIFLIDSSGNVIHDWTVLNDTRILPVAYVTTQPNMSVPLTVDADISQIIGGYDELTFNIWVGGIGQPGVGQIGGPLNLPSYCTLTYYFLPCYNMAPRLIDLNKILTPGSGGLGPVFGSVIDLSSWDGIGPVFLHASFQFEGQTYYSIGIYNGNTVPAGQPYNPVSKWSMPLSNINDWFMDISPYIIAGQNTIVATYAATDVGVTYGGILLSTFEIQTFDWPSSLLVNALDRAYTILKSVRLTP